MSEGEITKVMVHAVFHCDRCGAACERMTHAPYDATTGTLGPANRPPGEVTCNGCDRKARDAERDERKRKAAQRAWFNKHAHMLPPKVSPPL